MNAVDQLDRTAQALRRHRYIHEGKKLIKIN
jgi:hypothetical protein